MQPPKRSTTKRDQLQIVGEEALKFEWLNIRWKCYYTVYEIDNLIAAHKVSDREIEQYYRIDRELNYPSHWRLIQSLYEDHRNCNSDCVVDDSASFSDSVDLHNGQGRLRRDKLYTLYYAWSPLPMRREMFYSLFTRTHYPIPKQSALIKAFITTRKKNKSEERAERLRKLLLIAEIVYGKKEKVRKVLWNFW